MNMLINPLTHSASARKALVISVIILLAACSEQPQTSGEATQAAPAPQQATQEAVTPQPAQSATPTSNSGVVKSSQVAGAYSYIETDIDGSTFWIATAATAIKPGDKISWNDYAMMTNFTSKAVNKTFDQILFIDKVSNASTPAVANAHSGTVIETMNSAGYSYIQVEEKGDKLWLAAPQLIINAGQKISWSGGSAMQNFSSRSLDRTFDKIFFVSGIEITG
jgi:hypothetical protein